MKKNVMKSNTKHNINKSHDNAFTSRRPKYSAICNIEGYMAKILPDDVKFMNEIFPQNKKAINIADTTVFSNDMWLEIRAIISDFQNFQKKQYGNITNPNIYTNALEVVKKYVNNSVNVSDIIPLESLEGKSGQPKGQEVETLRCFTNEMSTCLDKLKNKINNDNTKNKKEDDKKVSKNKNNNTEQKKKIDDLRNKKGNNNIENKKEDDKKVSKNKNNNTKQKKNHKNTTEENNKQTNAQDYNRDKKNIQKGGTESGKNNIFCQCNIW